MSAPFILLAAGGTGGHLFPAEALAVALERRGARTALMTDSRASGLVTRFPAEAIHQVPAATPSGRSPIRMALAALTLGRGFLKARGIIGGLKPAVVVGFGGYPTVPPVLAAASLGIPTILHEQNAVMGRANRFLAGRVTAIATGFSNIRQSGFDPAKVTHVGNPVRGAVLEAAGTPYPMLDGRAVRLLVFGGSQGARVMSDIVPAAVTLLEPALRAHLKVTQQARPEDIVRVRDTYAHAGVAAEIEPFFKDLPRRIADSHLVVSRSGASTVAELAVIGRPSILVPLPGALDQDQAANARVLADIGAATLVQQVDFTPRWLAAELEARLGDPAGLTRAAQAAKSAGLPDAADRLAALVLDHAARA